MIWAYHTTLKEMVYVIDFAQRQKPGASSLQPGEFETRAIYASPATGSIYDCDVNSLKINFNKGETNENNCSG